MRRGNTLVDLTVAASCGALGCSIYDYSLPAYIVLNAERNTKMRILVSSLAVVVATTSISSAQQTYGELYEQGALQLSNMEVHLADLLRDHGISDECLSKLTVRDASEMNLIINEGDMSVDDKRDRIGRMLDEKCS
jgi:hypothetical protein